MKSPVELWDRANALADNNQTARGKVIDEDLWLSTNLIFDQLKAINDTMNLLLRDGFSMTRTNTIRLLDTSMEEIDEKLRILEDSVIKPAEVN